MGLDYLGRWLTRAFYAMGGVILLLKITGFHREVEDWQLGLGFACLLLPALILTALRAYSPREAAAWLDCRNEAGGRILGGRPIESDALALPRLSPTPLLRHTAIPLLFALGAHFIPGAEPASTASPEAIRQKIERVERKIETAQKKKALPPLAAHRMILQAQTLKRDARQMPEVAAEGAATLQAMLDKNVLDTAAQQLNAMKAAAAATVEEGAITKKEREALANALKQLSKQLGGMDKLPPELQKALAKAMKGLPKGSKGLDPSALNGLNAKALQSLAKSLMKNCQSGMKGMGQCQGLL
ncbi:MAG: hypothetical protein ACYTGH_07275, partial [Planctomycetota bacterium]